MGFLCFCTPQCVHFPAQSGFPSEKSDSHKCESLSRAEGKMPDGARLVIKTARINNTGKHLSFSPWKGGPAYLQLLASLKPSQPRLNTTDLWPCSVFLRGLLLQSNGSGCDCSTMLGTPLHPEQRGAEIMAAGGFVALALPVEDNRYITGLCLYLFFESPQHPQL